MAQNFPGPYEVEIRYTTAGLQHVHRVNCRVDGNPAPGTPVNDIDVLTNVDTTKDLIVAVDEYIQLWRPFYSNSDATFDDYTLWRYEPLTFDRTFIATSLLGFTGDSAQNSQLAHSTIFTFRTLEGGRMRLTFLEDIQQGFDRIPYAQQGVNAQAFSDYVVSAGGWILGRDTSRPVNPLAEVRGQNEVTFRQRFR